MLIAYIHGFQSSSAAIKARILREYFSQHAPQVGFLAPDFPDTPKEAFAALLDFCRDFKKDEFFLVGSSMGGFFSVLLSLRFGFKAALINPCLHPQNFCRNLLGRQLNSATGSFFTLTAPMLDYLQELDRQVLNYDKSKLKVYLQKGDEVLDYRVAAEFFADCPMVIEDGGSHGFTDFVSVVPDILTFFRQKN